MFDKINREVLRIYPDRVLAPDTMYGYPREIWKNFTPEQKKGAAEVFQLAYPELAMAAGAQEFLETETLSLEPLTKSTTES